MLAEVMSYDAERHGPQRIVGPGFHERVQALARQVPPGAVTTYGDLAAALGRRSVARHVGWALAALPVGSDVPWHRVVDGQGRISRAGSPNAAEQRRRLRAEGVGITADGAVRGFAARRWTPPSPTA